MCNKYIKRGISTLLVAAMFLTVPGCSKEKAVVIEPMEKEEVHTLYFDALGGKDVMPISGYYGPRDESVSFDGQSLPDQFTDEMFQNIAGCGVNMIHHTYTNYQLAPELTIKMLELGEKYGIGINVQDSQVSQRLDGDALPLEEGYVIIGKPVAAPTVDDSFKKITFNSYDIESGIYKYNPLGLSTSGDCGLTSLDRVVFSDTVNFSDAAGVQMRFGGKSSPWEGMVWESIGDGKLQLTAATGGFPAMVFDSETAGVKLTGNDVEVIFSFEYVDSDGDGKKDDVKFGVWFDGKAYNNRWIYLRDYAKNLGGFLGVYCPNEQTTMKIYTYMPPIDFAEFGFTVNWAIELGLKKK